jgi:hypothetical protein
MTTGGQRRGRGEDHQNLNKEEMDKYLEEMRVELDRKMLKMQQEDEV